MNAPTTLQDLEAALGEAREALAAAETHFAELTVQQLAHPDDAKLEAEIAATEAELARLRQRIARYETAQKTLRQREDAESVAAMQDAKRAAAAELGVALERNIALAGQFDAWIEAGMALIGEVEATNGEMGRLRHEANIGGRSAEHHDPMRALGNALAAGLARTSLEVQNLLGRLGPIVTTGVYLDQAPSATASAEHEAKRWSKDIAATADASV